MQKLVIKLTQHGAQSYAALSRVEEQKGSREKLEKRRAFTVSHPVFLLPEQDYASL